MALLSVKRKAYGTDQSLIEGLKRNESRALEALYEMSFGQVKQWISQNNGSEQDAEDVFQDAVLAIWKNVKEGKYEKKQHVKLSTYVFQVCKFRWFENLKSARVKYSTKLDTEMDIIDTHDMEALAEESERMKYLHKLFQQLGDKCRKILQFYYYQKMPLAQIAEQMGYTAQSAKNEKYRCMQRLKKLHRN